MAQSQDTRVADMPDDGLQRSPYVGDFDDADQPIDRIRAAVDMTKEAAHAISITALEAVREGALFMGVIGSRGELVNPFRHIDAAIWTEPDVPDHMIETAYEYCEELTRREAGNFYH
ncbi:MAG: hypothetical protein VX909_00785, partial [Candidatus Thermoplasmatota archaeon]|nr:hypothetical protein [Candidatus Thermoplasmatota archaeon]